MIEKKQRITKKMKNELTSLLYVGIGLVSLWAVQAKDIVVFDAEKTSGEDIRNSTAHWIEGSDLLPVTSDETRNGQNWIKFQYEGKNGIANSKIATVNPELLENTPGESVSGLKFKLLTEDATPRPIFVLILFEDKSELHCRVLMNSGETEYTVLDGWRRDKEPYEWNKIRTIFFRMQPDYFVNNEAPVFYLQKISLITSPTN
jgi:hypothetical protein